MLLKIFLVACLKVREDFSLEPALYELDIRLDEIELLSLTVKCTHALSRNGHSVVYNTQCIKWVASSVKDVIHKLCPLEDRDWLPETIFVAAAFRIAQINRVLHVRQTLDHFKPARSFVSCAPSKTLCHLWEYQQQKTSQTDRVFLTGTLSLDFAQFPLTLRESDVEFVLKFASAPYHLRHVTMENLTPLQFPVCFRIVEILAKRQLPIVFEFKQMPPKLTSMIRNLLTQLPEAATMTCNEPSIGFYTTSFDFPPAVTGLIDLGNDMVIQLYGQQESKRQYQQKMHTLLAALSCIVREPIAALNGAHAVVGETLKHYLGSKDHWQHDPIPLHSAMQHIFKFLDTNINSVIRAGGNIGAMALACVVHDAVAPPEYHIIGQCTRYGLPSNMDEVLMQWRAAVRHHHPRKFKYSFYQKLTGRDLHKDLRSIGYHNSWRHLHDKYHSQLYS